ncbi:MAG: hypothetical protein L0Z62_22920, partial [Gemmataceae bacterium]|nr:hypothetical protein [Gemmataceae bacterium]
MFVISFLRSWFRRERLPLQPLPGKPTLETLEDRCLPATGVGVFLPDWGSWLLRSVPSAGAPDITPFPYGGAHWSPVAGDWDGDGSDGVAAFSPTTATWYLRQQPSRGAPDLAPFSYGGVDWLPVAGDWNGDGRDSIGVFDPHTATWYLKNDNSLGAPDIAPFAYGMPGWLPVVGDWNGDGTDSIGVFDPTTATFYLRNSNSPGYAHAGIIHYGTPGWLPVVGDWDGDGRDTLGVFDPTTAAWYLKNTNTPGAPDLTPFRYGSPGWLPLTFDTPFAAQVQPSPGPEPDNPGENPLPVPDTAAPGGETVVVPPATGAPPAGGLPGPVPQAVRVTLEAPATAEAPSFTATVTAQADLGVQPLLLLDVDLDGDGAFTSPGEASYARGATQGNGRAEITVAGLVPGSSYNLRARAFDLHGAEGVSAVSQVRLNSPASAYLPLAFEVNRGQTDGQAQFLARASGYAGFLTAEGLYLSFAVPASGNTPDSTADAGDLKVSLAGSNLQVAQAILFTSGKGAAPLEGEGQLPGNSNYFLGNDPSRWITDVPTFSRVRARGVWAGIDVVYRSDGGRLNYDFEVAPGADPSVITLELPWAVSVSVDEAGQLLVDTGMGQVAQSAPVAYQIRPDGSKQALASRYVERGGNQVGFEVIGRDPARPLVIDPYIYNTFLGGSGDDRGHGIAIDASFNVYLTGET